MLRLLLICILFSLAHWPAFTQSKVGQTTLDSLLAELPRAKLDTHRFKLLNYIGLGYYTFSNPNEGINYANQALVLARQLRWKKGQATAYRSLGDSYTSKSDYSKSLDYQYDIITKGHGGSLTVESQQGEGTTIIIHLPATIYQL